MDVFLDTVASVILDDLALGLGYDAVVLTRLTRLILFLFVIVVVRNKYRAVVTRNA